jgi:hypothetical protein
VRKALQLRNGAGLAHDQWPECAAQLVQQAVVVGGHHVAIQFVVREQFVVLVFLEFYSGRAEQAADFATASIAPGHRLNRVAELRPALEIIAMRLVIEARFEQVAEMRFQLVHVRELRQFDRRQAGSRFGIAAGIARVVAHDLVA